MNQQHVIIAEDKKNTSRVYAMCLAGQFPTLKVDIVDNGQELVKRVLANGYDLAIVDDTMEREHAGLEATKRIREAENNVPIYMISARGDIEERAREYGANEFSAKPLGLDEFLDNSGKYLI